MSVVGICLEQGSWFAAQIAIVNVTKTTRAKYDGSAAWIFTLTTNLA